MKERIISDKDLLYIKDMLNWNEIMIKKISHYMDLSSDKETIKMLSKASKMHYDHYNVLLNILKNG